MGDDLRQRLIARLDAESGGLQITRPMAVDAILDELAKPPSVDLRQRSFGPELSGRCPACKRASLFVGVGGHVTCSRLDCPDPTAADDVLRGDGQAWRERAENAEAILHNLADRNPCDHFDHHGYCQTHGWLEGGECAHARAQKLLAALAALDDPQEET